MSSAGGCGLKEPGDRCCGTGHFSPRWWSSRRFRCISDRRFRSTCRHRPARNCGRFRRRCSRSDRLRRDLLLHVDRPDVWQKYCILCSLITNRRNECSSIREFWCINGLRKETCIVKRVWLISRHLRCVRKFRGWCHVAGARRRFSRWC